MQSYKLIEATSFKERDTTKPGLWTMDWTVDWAFLIEMSCLAINWFAAWNLNFDGWPYARKKQRVSRGLYEGFHRMKKN